MALVAYENSDSSDYEEDENVSTSEAIVLISKKDEGLNESETPASTNVKVENGHLDDEETQNLFNCLPQPTIKQKINIIEEDDEFLHKKETVSDVKPKSKITVPSLSDFKDVKDTVPARPKVTNGKKSGLLSILPRPKNSFINSTTTTTTTKVSKPLIPHVLTNKPQTPTAKKTQPHPTPSKKPKLDSKVNSSASTQHSDDSDDDEDMQNDFFSIHKPVAALPIEELPLDIEQPSSSKVKETSNIQSEPRTLESYFKQDDTQSHVEEEQDNIEESNVMYSTQVPASNDYTSQSGDIALDEEAILKLCGSRGKRKKEDIQIVDVNQQEVLADAREWLLKGLMDDTSKRVSASTKRGNEPTSQQKRKHQITYLAHQAKANEIELQNQWANNRMTKRQTQSKYGF